MRQARAFEQAGPAGDWIAATFGAWRAELSASELIALAAYKGSEYRDINGALRGQRPMTAGVEVVIDALDRALARMRLPEPMIAYRAAGIPALATFAGDLGGTVIEEHGYVSTSLLRDTAVEYLLEIVPLEHGVIERIYVPGGTHVAVQAAAPDLVTDLGEYELLLPHDTLLLVTADHGNEKTTYRSIDVEVILR